MNYPANGGSVVCLSPPAGPNCAFIVFFPAWAVDMDGIFCLACGNTFAPGRLSACLTCMDGAQAT